MATILAPLLIIAVAFLAFANGANDNFKGVASIYGSGVGSYRAAIAWATVTTAAGSFASLFLAQALLHKFSGKGLVPDALAASPQFLAAIAVGAGLTVILATQLSFPISTTHAILGAMIGAGWTAAGLGALRLKALETGFVLPLLLSPVIAMAGAAIVHLFLPLRRR